MPVAELFNVIAAPTHTGPELLVDAILGNGFTVMTVVIWQLVLASV